MSQLAADQKHRAVEALVVADELLEMGIKGPEIQEFVDSALEDNPHKETISAYTEMRINFRPISHPGLNEVPLSSQFKAQQRIAIFQGGEQLRRFEEETHSQVAEILGSISKAEKE